jgi:prolipoprotein diacylglyceryltransferase
LLFLRFTAWSSGLRLFLDAFRGDSTLILDGIRIEQVIAWVVLAFSLLGILKLSNPSRAPENI